MSIVAMAKQDSLDAVDAQKYRNMLRHQELDTAYATGLDSGQMEVLSRFKGASDAAYDQGIQEGVYLGEKLAMSRPRAPYIPQSEAEQRDMDRNMQKGYSGHRDRQISENRVDAKIVPNVANKLGNAANTGMDYITDTIFNAQGER